MRRRFILFLVTMLLIIPSPFRAQGDLTLESLQISLWPEHDQPSMLVIYDFRLSRDTQLPVRINIPIPREANVTAVAFYDADGQLLLANYQNLPSEDAGWQIVSLEISEQTTYRIEYYQPLLREGAKRSFNYQWRGVYPVQNFNIEIEVPSDSTGVQTSPSMPFILEQPVLTGRAMKRDMPIGQGYEIRLEYSRESETPILPPASTGIQPSEPLNENTEGRVTLDNLPYVLGGVGILLVLSALYYSWRIHLFRGEAKPRKRQRRAESEGAQKYCHECGARAQAGDRFCRACGSKLRIE
jgi:hypothetical protein